MPQPKFVVVDGNAIIHRAYHAIPPLTTKDGTVVNAVYGFASMIIKMLGDLKPEFVAVTFDLAGPTFRHKQYDQYKATRVKADQSLYDQIPLVKQAVEAFGFQIFAKEGYEADDVIGTLVKQAYGEPIEIYIVTGDMDTMQLVNGKVKVYTLKKGLSDIVIYDEKAVMERYGLRPDQMIDYKAIRGDASDNIPGVPGIGEKGATELVQKAGSIENIYENIGKLKELGIRDSVIKKLEAGKESALMSKQLSTIDTAVPELNFSLEKCRVGEIDREKIISLFQKLEFTSLLKRIPQFKNVVQKSTDEQGARKNNVRNDTDGQGSRKNTKVDFNFREITKEGELEELTAEIAKYHRVAARFILDNADFFNNKIVGVAVAVGRNAYFVNEKLAEKTFEIFGDNANEIVGHDLKQLIKTLESRGRDCKGKLFDVMVASYILNPGSRAHDIPSLVLKVLGKELVGASGQESLFGIDKRVAAYEIFLVLQIADQLKKELQKIDNLGLLEKIEMPLIPVLSRMELNGVLVDRAALEELSVRLVKQIKEVSAKIYEEAGMEFNISSPLQLREVLFEKLQIPTDGVKKGKTGLSTSAEELERLRGLHPVIEHISTYRELTKLQNTYVDTLPKLINPKSGRIHSTFNQVVAATGRLSSSDPNLQNIPIRTELGREIRTAFIADKGYELVSADYSQIELRVVASLAEDKKMVEIFEKGEDIHRATAAAIHGVSLEEVTKEMRYSAKEVNFGVLYGMGVYGLSWRADIPHAEAKKFITKYFEEFSGVKQYIDRTLEFTKKEGYCETLFGRRRYLPELNSTNYQVRSGAERMAINHPVQGTAADIMKLAMIEVHQEFEKIFKKDEVKMLMQVHDELVLEVKEKLVEDVGNKLKEIMEKVVTLRVPVKAEVAWGKRWGNIK